MSFLASEIASQPAAWRRVKAVADAHGDVLPKPDERVAAVGCGTSWFVAEAYTALREAAGLGEADAFAASEMPTGRRYDRVLAITRSGTTTEVLTLLEALGRAAAAPGPATTAITADATTPVIDAARSSIVLDFADERSVVQTVFATTALALLRTHLGEDMEPLARHAAAVLAEPPPAAELMGAEQFTFLGHGWAHAIAREAALKMREAAQAWTEAYPAMEYRHGPISIAGPNRVVWILGAAPGGLADDIAQTGATLVHNDADPMVELVRVQALAGAIAEHKGLDPDRPRHLTRSVVLSR